MNVLDLGEFLLVFSVIGERKLAAAFGISLLKGTKLAGRAWGYTVVQN